MSWELLPTEISVYILKLRHEFRNNACKKIQNAWTKFILPEVTAIDIALNIEIDQYDNIMVSIPSTYYILKKCTWIISGKHHLWIWKMIAKKIEYSLNINKYSPDEWLQPHAVNDRKIKIAYGKLLKKLELDTQQTTQQSTTRQSTTNN